MKLAAGLVTCRSADFSPLHRSSSLRVRSLAGFRAAKRAETHAPVVALKLAIICAVSVATLARESAFAGEAPKETQNIVGDWQGGAGGYVAQVVAGSNGTFHANLLKRFDATDNLVAVLRGSAEGRGIAFSGDGWAATLANGRLKGKRDAESFDLQSVIRHSPTENAKPPTGAIVLFDGSSLDHWARQKGKEWEQPDGPVTAWRLADGVVETVPGAGSIITKKHFGDCKLHVEFRTLGPVNSGVYLQARYEIGINESYGRREGSPCGAFGNSPDAPKPKINASLPPFQWQTFDIEFCAPRFDSAGKKTENARATIVLNGVTISGQAEIPSVRGAAKRLGETPAAPLMLQEHGEPIQFRNIWLVETPR